MVFKGTVRTVWCLKGLCIQYGVQNALSGSTLMDNSVYVFIIIRNLLKLIMNHAAIEWAV